MQTYDRSFNTIMVAELRAVSYTHLDVYKRQVYKLCAVEKDGKICPRIKISDNVAKISTPCFKKPWLSLIHI